MKRRGKGRGRNPKRKGYTPRHEQGMSLPSNVPVFKPLGESGLMFWRKPEMRLALGLGGLLVDYLCEKFIPGATPQWSSVVAENLTEEARAEIAASLRSQIARAQHPEANEPIWTSIDERQEGRSEVIRELSNPKQS